MKVISVREVLATRGLGKHQKKLPEEGGFEPRLERNQRN